VEARPEYVRPAVQEGAQKLTEKQSIHEQLRDAQAAEEPKVVVSSSMAGVTMNATELQSAGYVYVYDNRTGDRSVVNRNMLEQQLQKRREDGTYAFTTQKPELEREYGYLKCLLHKDDPNRKLYDRMGLAICTKDNLTASHDLRVHMEKRHRREWATIDGERIEEERKRARDNENNLADAIRLLAERDSSQNTRGKSNG
jgi:hypothetical protein